MGGTVMLEPVCPSASGPLPPGSLESAEPGAAEAVSFEVLLALALDRGAPTEMPSEDRSADTVGPATLAGAALAGMLAPLVASGGPPGPASETATGPSAPTAVAPAPAPTGATASAGPVPAPLADGLPVAPGPAALIGDQGPQDDVAFIVADPAGQPDHGERSQTGESRFLTLRSGPAPLIATVEPPAAVFTSSGPSGWVEGGDQPPGPEAAAGRSAPTEAINLSAVPTNPSARGTPEETVGPAGPRPTAGGAPPAAGTAGEPAAPRPVSGAPAALGEAPAAPGGTPTSTPTASPQRASAPAEDRPVASMPAGQSVTAGAPARPPAASPLESAEPRFPQSVPPEAGGRLSGAPDGPGTFGPVAGPPSADAPVLEGASARAAATVALEARPVAPPDGAEGHPGPGLADRPGLATGGTPTVSASPAGSPVLTGPASAERASAGQTRPAGQPPAGPAAADRQGPVGAPPAPEGVRLVPPPADAQSGEPPVATGGHAERPSTASLWPTVGPQLVGPVLAALRGGGRRQEIALHLQPEWLGRLAVRIVHEGENLTITLYPDQPQVRQALEAHLPDLRQALSESGLAMARLSVAVGGGAQGGSGSPYEPPPLRLIVERPAPEEQRPTGGPATGQHQVDYRV